MGGGAPQHGGRGRPNPACRGKGGSVGACLCVVQCGYNSFTTRTWNGYLCAPSVCEDEFFFAEGEERSILHNIWWGDKLPSIAKVPLGPSMPYKCQSGAESPGLRLCFPVDNLIEKVSLNTSAGGARAHTRRAWPLIIRAINMTGCSFDHDGHFIIIILMATHLSRLESNPVHQVVASRAAHWAQV